MLVTRISLHSASKSYQRVYFLRACTIPSFEFAIYKAALFQSQTALRSLFGYVVFASPTLLESSIPQTSSSLRGDEHFLAKAKKTDGRKGIFPSSVFPILPMNITKKGLPKGSPLHPDYTGIVLFSALSIVLSILSCCA